MISTVELHTGRYCLMIAGWVIAVETDPCREWHIEGRFWTKEMLDQAAAHINEEGHMIKPMREWNELYPKERELFASVVNERDAATAEVKRLREALARFADPDRWRETDDTNSDGWPIKVWAWSTIDLPWETAQRLLDREWESL